MDLHDNDGVKSGSIKLSAALLPSSNSTPASSVVSEANVPVPDSTSATALSVLQAKSKSLEVELERTKEMLHQRERALEANASVMADSVQENEQREASINDLLQRIEGLDLELREKDNSLRILQKEAIDTNGLEADIVALRTELQVTMSS